MDKFFDNFYNHTGFGPAIDPVIPTKSYCDDYKGMLPDQLVEYWQQYGFSGWGKGLFWIVNPLEYKGVLQGWLKGTPLENQDEYNVIARTAFGTLYVWGKNTGHSITILPHYGMLFPNDQTDNILSRGEDRMVKSFFSSKKLESCDFKDEGDKTLFQRSKEKLGQLNHDEMYAFVPALALGGRAELKNLQKVNIIEHLALLTDLGEKRIMQDVNKVLGPVN